MPLSQVETECDRRVLRRLKTIERTLIQLFQLDRPTELIKEKLEQMSELTVNLPECYGEQAFEEWSGKMAAWWQQYSDMVLKFQMSAQISQNVFVSSSQTKSFNFLLPDDTIEAKQAKDSVRAKLRKEFDLVPPILDETDRDGLRRLLSTMARARSLTAPFWQDYLLHAEIFCMAIQKLSLVVCHQFAQQYDPTQRRRSLRDLYRFLAEMLKAQTGNLIPQIQLNFSALPPMASPTDIASMKSLLVEMSRALKTIACSYYGENKDSKFACVYHFAAAKLDSELLEEFQQPSDWTKTWIVRLKDMRHFIAKKIITIHKEAEEKGKTLDDILDLMKHELEQLDGEAEEDNGKLINFEDFPLDQLKSLLRLVLKARAHLLTFREHDQYNRLQTNLFDMAFLKLPIDLKIKYLRIDPDIQDKSLTEVIKLLSNQIIDSTIPQSDQVVRSVVENCVGDPGFCDYCKTIGHQAEQCEVLREIICHRCFETGHQAKDCVDAGGSRDFCLECAQFGHASSFCPSAVCFRCQKLGHMSRQCTV